MVIPTALDLATGKFLRPPTTARGVYLDRQPGRSDVHMRFVWAAPNKWVWMHAAEPAAGVITDGTTNVIVDDGVAILVTDQGEAGSTHRLRDLFLPSAYDLEGWELSPVSAGTAIGRAAWFLTATPRIQGKIAHEIVFDEETGVILFHRAGGDHYFGFEELVLDEEISDDAFRWHGPVEPRRVGTALVIPEEDGTHSVIWEVSVRGRSMFHQPGPGGIGRDEAVAWGEERAAKIFVRGE